MERQLINYLPYTVRAFKEYQGITTGEQPEFELAWNWVDEVLKNQFILTAEEIGLSRWEKILRVRPRATDTYEIRRLRILSILWKRIPYTFPWLNEWIGLICGPDGHTEIVSDYTLSITLNCNVLENVTEKYWIILEQLPYIAPENLVIELARVWQYSGTLYVGAFTAFKQALEVWPDPVFRLEATDENKVKGLSSMKNQMEIYPDVASALQLRGKEKTAGFSKIEHQIEVYPRLSAELNIEGSHEAKSITGTYPKIHVFPRAATRLETVTDVDNAGLMSARNTIEIYPE